MKPAKRKKKLESRIKDYEDTIRKLQPKQAAGFRKPGSLKK